MFNDTKYKALQKSKLNGAKYWERLYLTVQIFAKVYAKQCKLSPTLMLHMLMIEYIKVQSTGKVNAEWYKLQSIAKIKA